MEKAKVYFTDFHTVAFGDGLPAKLKKLIRTAGIGQIDMDGKFAAIKMHFGELGNISFLRPNYAKAVAQRRHPLHFSGSILGLPSLCWSFLPARDPQPMPMFFIAPPKPVIS